MKTIVSISVFVNRSEKLNYFINTFCFLSVRVNAYLIFDNYTKILPILSSLCFGWNTDKKSDLIRIMLTRSYLILCSGAFTTRKRKFTICASKKRTSFQKFSKSTCINNLCTQINVYYLFGTEQILNWNLKIFLFERIIVFWIISWKIRMQSRKIFIVFIDKYIIR